MELITLSILVLGLLGLAFGFLFEAYSAWYSKPRTYVTIGTCICSGLVGLALIYFTICFTIFIISN